MLNPTFAPNGEIAVHYIALNAEATGLPVLIIPGMLGRAEDYAEELAERTRRPLFCLSLRGRGMSTAPASGYSFREQLTDVQAVIDHLGLDEFVLFAHSAGVPFAVGAALNNAATTRGLALADYPPFYPALNDEWVEHVLASELPRDPEIIKAMAREADETIFRDELGQLNMPVLLLRGAQEGAMLNDDMEAFYKHFTPDFRVQTLQTAGHEVLGEATQEFVGALEDFASQLEAR